MRQVQKAYQLDGGAGCRQCIMPHSMCAKYSVDGRNGRRQYDPQQACRHNGVIIAGWVGVLQSGQEYFRKHWVDEMMAKGIGEQGAME